jgi:hypothetical protein
LDREILTQQCRKYASCNGIKRGFDFGDYQEYDVVSLFTSWKFSWFFGKRNGVKKHLDLNSKTTPIIGFLLNCVGKNDEFVDRNIEMEKGIFSDIFIT